jgi:hypothetical protein
MMRAYAFLLALVPQAAQADETLSSAICRALLESAREALGEVGGLVLPSTARLTEGGCAASGLAYRPESPYATGFEVDQIVWSGAGLADFAETGTVPLSLDLAAEGFRFAIRPDDPVFAYLLEAQSYPNVLDISLVLARDPEARTLSLSQLAVDFPGENALSLSATFVNVDLSTALGAGTSLGSFGLTALSLDIETHGLFEGYLLMPLGTDLLAGAEDPEARVEDLKREALAHIQALPSGLADGETKSALARLVGDMPNPKGRISLRIEAAQGIGPARFARFAGGEPEIGDILAALDGVRIDVRYEAD